MKALFERKTVAKLALAGAALASGWAAVAQTVDEQPMAPPTLGLDLPNEMTIFGPVDPHVRKATAIVNGSIITDTDIEQRLALVLAANNGRVSPEERERLRLQVIRNLIDETLQIQEAATHEVSVSPEEIEQTFRRVAGNFRRQPGEFTAYLREIGSSERSLKRQIEGEMAWQRVLGRRIRPFINVGEEEAQAVMNRLNASRGSREYRVGEIFLASTGDGTQTLQDAQRIVTQLRQGASFVAYARQFSQASTAAVGGDLGWVRAEQLPPELSSIAQQLPNGQISDPIAVPGGYSIVAMIDQRSILTADARDALLTLKQISISFPHGMTQTQASPLVARFAERLRTINGCGNAAAIAGEFQAEVVDSEGVRVRDLPPQLQQIMIDMQVGQATPPFGSLDEGVRSLVVCGRDEQQSASGPTVEQINEQLEEERVNRRAQTYLRNLRRDAVIEYR